MKPDQFKEWRKRLALTQADAGTRFGVTRMTIQNWESGATPIPPMVEMGCEIWEREHRKRDDYGPVTLIYADGSMFVNPYGPRRIAMMQRELYPNNGAALARVCELYGRADFHNPFIVNEENDFVWNGVELGRYVRERQATLNRQPRYGNSFVVIPVRLPLPREAVGSDVMLEGKVLAPSPLFATWQEALEHARPLVQQGYRVAISGPGIDWNENDVIRQLDALNEGGQT
jgi:Helix-turn-helix